LPLILDTGPVYASLDRSDRHHHACRSLIERSDESLVIPAPVLVEVDFWIQERLDPGVLLALLADIEAGAYVVGEPSSSGLRPRSTNLRPTRGRRYWLCRRGGAGDRRAPRPNFGLDEPKLATLDRLHFGAVLPRHVHA